MLTNLLKPMVASLSVMSVYLLSSCDSNCKEIDHPNYGTYIINEEEYIFHNFFGNPEIISSTVEVSGGTIVIDYTRVDGSSWRVIYDIGDME